MVKVAVLPSPYPTTAVPALSHLIAAQSGAAEFSAVLDASLSVKAIHFEGTKGNDAI